MKILYVSTLSITINGFLIPHIAMLVNGGHTVDVACGAADALDPRLTAMGCRVFNIDFQRSPLDKRNFTAVKEARKLVTEERYDLIHTHTPVASTCIRLACRKLPGVKIFYTAHGFYFYKGAPLKHWLVYYPIERFLSRYTDLLITINKEDFIRAKKSLKAKKTVYVPGVGIDTNRMNITSVDPERKKAALGIPADTAVILSVGELNPKKNHAASIRAAAKLRNIPFTFIICGSGGEQARLTALIDQYGLSDKVRLLGQRSDVFEILQITDLFVHASFREGLPVALMEAMAAGLPCIVSDIRGNTDLIEDGKGGCIFRPDDIDELAAAIDRLLSDSQSAARMGSHNKEAIKPFDIEPVLAEMQKHYDIDTSRSAV